MQVQSAADSAAAISPEEHRQQVKPAFCSAGALLTYVHQDVQRQPLMISIDLPMHRMSRIECLGMIAVSFGSLCD